AESEHPPCIGRAFVYQGDLPGEVLPVVHDGLRHRSGLVVIPDDDEEELITALLADEEGDALVVVARVVGEQAVDGLLRTLRVQPAERDGDVVARHRRHPRNSRSLRLTKASRPTMTWSATSMPRISPAFTSSLVSAISGGLGSGSPEGWLWTSTTEGALVMTASRSTSAARKFTELTLPW